MENILKKLRHDSDGMETYEYIINNAEDKEDLLPELIEILHESDNSGQFLASTARFLTAVDSERFRPYIFHLVEGAIDRDRERKYIGSLLDALWGHNYEERADELQRTDDLFRRVYKRLYPSKSIDNIGHEI